MARAEKLADGTLTVVVSSSAVASELSFVRDLLLEQINRELLSAVSLLDEKQKRQVRPVLRIQNRVGKLGGLPDPMEWQERPTVTKRPPPPAPSLESQLAVAEASQGMHDDELRFLMLRLVGADLRPVPAVPYKDPNNYVKLSGRLAEELNGSLPNGAIWANQFDNVANRLGHYRTTGPEIWEQTDGGLDGFICAVGSGGTLAGAGMFLKERNPQVRIGLADPMGAALYNWYEHGELKAEGSSISEGIGQGRITANLEGAPVDDAFQITDAEALPYIFDLILEEGLVLGSSSAINIAGAVRMAESMGPGHTIVTMLCDYGTRYQSKLFNPQFLREKDLPVPSWLA